VSEPVNLFAQNTQALWGGCRGVRYGQPPVPTSSPAEVVRAKRIATRVVHVESEPTPTVRVSPRRRQFIVQLMLSSVRLVVLHLRKQSY